MGGRINYTILEYMCRSKYIHFIDLCFQYVSVFGFSVCSSLCSSLNVCQHPHHNELLVKSLCFGDTIVSQRRWPVEKIKLKQKQPAKDLLPSSWTARRRADICARCPRIMRRLARDLWGCDVIHFSWAGLCEHPIRGVEETEPRNAGWRPHLLLHQYYLPLQSCLFLFLLLLSPSLSFMFVFLIKKQNACLRVLRY